MWRVASSVAWLGAAGVAGVAYATAAPEPVTDSTVSLAEAVGAVEACEAGCAGVVYFWSPRMPLSRSAIPEISRAASGTGVGLTIVATEDLHAYAVGGAEGVAARPVESRESDRGTAESILRAGALAHAPALVVYRGGRVLGPAILGYKTADAYRQLIESRLAEAEATEPRPTGPAVRGPAPTRARVRADYQAVGLPGAYFRWVPGRNAIAYESRRRIYLLDLGDARSLGAPGYVDFVPTPDGRYFVTPGPGRDGLHFYEADAVFAAAAASGTRVEPFFEDPQMSDQYPSIGILAGDEGRTVYRVLTSWFTGIAYRDYEIRPGARGGSPRVRPLGDPVVPCRGSSLSIPIMAQDGREVAARDESSGTTKIFRMLPGGRCDEVEDLGVQTSKVAWHSTGRLLAFARPRVRTAQADRVDGTQGIFLYDRDDATLSRIEGSEVASPLAFPDFIGEDELVYLVPQRRRGEVSLFRVVEGIR